MASRILRRVTLTRRLVLNCRFCSELLLKDISGPIDVRAYEKKELSKLAKQIRRVSNINSASLCVLGTGGNEIVPSFYLNCQERSYLFNCGEGWHKAASEHRLHSFCKSQITLFTRAAWENVSGCAGLHKFREAAQATQDYGGPPKSAELMQFFSRICGRLSWQDVMPWKQNAKERTFSDNNVTISMIKIDSPKAEDRNTLVAYSCKLVDTSGKFFPEKAEELGVPHVAYKFLSGGYSIITEDGRTVHSSEVTEEGKKGSTFLVVDCPAERFLEDVTSNPRLQSEWFKERGESVSFVVHITPLEILENKRYCKWMGRFGERTKHLLLHSSVCPGEVGCRAFMAFSLPFHLFNPNVYHFPRLPESNIIPKSSLTASKYIGEDAIEIGRMFMSFDLKSKSDHNKRDCLEPLQSFLETELKGIKKNGPLFKKIRRSGHFLSSDGKFDDASILNGSYNTPELKDPKDALVTILGTSAACPTHYRNESGILVQTKTDGNMLLDCGEETLCQLHRAFGKRGTEEILARLKVVFISHIHGDHHMGVFLVLQEALRLKRDRGDTSTIKLFGAESYIRLLNRYMPLLGSIDDLVFIVLKSMKAPFIFNISEDLSLQFVEVNHIKRFASSFGAVIRRKGMWSLVYSGDTAPCKRLIEAGQNATLLIHEGTFEEEFRDRARECNHSTYFDALQVAKAMKANFTIVTHFSVRYTLFPLMKFYRQPNSCPAVDLMSVRMSDVHEQQLDAPQYHEDILKYFENR